MQIVGLIPFMFDICQVIDLWCYESRASTYSSFKSSSCSL